MESQLSFWPDRDRPGYKKIFRPWRINPLTGQREYPKHARVFVMWVRDDGRDGND